MGTIGTCDACGAQATFLAEGEGVAVDDWMHRTKTRPQFLRFVVWGQSPQDWLDFCPACAERRSGTGWGPPPMAWSVCRVGLLVAAFFGTMVFWTHVILAGRP